jgi:lysine biosynthesis protein LysW
VKDTQKTLTAECPSCAARIHFKNRPNLGDIIVCHESKDNLEVIWLNPIKLDWSLLDDDIDWSDVSVDDYEDGYNRSNGYEWN